MNSEPARMSVAEAKRQLAQMQDSLVHASKRTAVDREYRSYLEVQIQTYENAITEFEAREKKGD